MARRMIIAIDGPAGSGKSTLARAVASRLNYRYIDTGGMYRAVTLLAQREGLSFDDPTALAACALRARIELRVMPESTRVFLNDEDVEDLIRTPEISKLTSQKTANSPGVRETMRERQRAFGLEGGVVMEGRDIGTVVFPNADLKVYFEVSAQERAQRRVKDYQERGITFDSDSVLTEIKSRDSEDMGRPIGPLKRAEDAILIKGDDKRVADLVDEVLSHLPEVPAEKTGFTYWLSRFVSGTLLRIFFRFKSVGWENVPKNGGVILCSNHQSFLDPLVVGCGNKRLPVRFMARASLWNVKFLAPWYDSVGAFPVKRGGADRGAWKKFEELVAGGSQICFFPEGTRSPDGNLQPANPGSGMLLHRCPEAKIVPVRVFNTAKVMPKNKLFGGFHRVSVAYGPVLDLSEYLKMEGNRENYAKLADRVMQAIGELKEPE